MSATGRRDFLGGVVGFAISGGQTLGQTSPAVVGFRLTDVTGEAGLRFRHDAGARGQKWLPETMGPGCAFIDYDGDGWQDILLLDGGPLDRASPPTHSGIRLYRNQRNGTFRDVTRESGLWQPMYALGVAVGDFNNNGFPDIYVTCVGQNRLFANLGNGRFRDVTDRAGLGNRRAFSTSAAWVDFDRDGYLDLFVCNYVQWRADRDVFCSADGKSKSYCTPEAYEGSTSWLFRNRGDGTFEDVTVSSGVFDRTSKALGVVVLDVNQDGWPDLFVANDTQPNKIYRNQRNGRFQEVGLDLGVAFSEDGKARAGMGADAGDLLGTGRESLVVTNFENEMAGLYVPGERGMFVDRAGTWGLAASTRRSLGFGCFFFDVDQDGSLDLLIANGHIDAGFARLGTEGGMNRSPLAQAPQLFLQRGGRFVEQQVAGGFSTPKVGRGAAFGDFDNDGDLDLLLATNDGPVHLYRNDLTNQNKSLRLTLEGTRSNRSAIGAVVRTTVGALTQMRRVRSGSSYLSQSELPVTFGLGTTSEAARVVVEWPSGSVQDFSKVKAGAYHLTEGAGLQPARR